MLRGGSVDNGVTSGRGASHRAASSPVCSISRDMAATSSCAACRKMLGGRCRKCIFSRTANSIVYRLKNQVNNEGRASSNSLMAAARSVKIRSKAAPASVRRTLVMMMSLVDILGDNVTRSKRAISSWCWRRAVGVKFELMVMLEEGQAGARTSSNINTSMKRDTSVEWKQLTAQPQLPTARSASVPNRMCPICVKPLVASTRGYQRNSPPAKRN